jgi:hypothetical protein
MKGRSKDEVDGMKAAFHEKYEEVVEGVAGRRRS